jgi:hypothetical protein
MPRENRNSEGMSDGYTICTIANEGLSSNDSIINECHRYLYHFSNLYTKDEAAELYEQLKQKFKIYAIDKMIDQFLDTAKKPIVDCTSTTILSLGILYAAQMEAILDEKIKSECLAYMSSFGHFSEMEVMIFYYRLKEKVA